MFSMNQTASNTKHEIAMSALKLFLNQGYESATMQQLSEQTGRSLGNINYHFRRKEDILMFLHKNTIKRFIEEILDGCEELENPWIRYLTVHLAYLFMVIREPSILNLYISATRLPSARADYIQIFYEIFLKYFDADKAQLDKEDVFMKVIVLCGSEFEMVNLYSMDVKAYDFGFLMAYPIKAFLKLFSFELSEIETMTEHVLPLGRKMASQYWNTKESNLIRQLSPP